MRDALRRVRELDRQDGSDFLFGLPSADLQGMFEKVPRLQENLLQIPHLDMPKMRRNILRKMRDNLQRLQKEDMQDPFPRRPMRDMPEMALHGLRRRLRRLRGPCLFGSHRRLRPVRRHGLLQMHGPVPCMQEKATQETHADLPPLRPSHLPRLRSPMRRMRGNCVRRSPRVAFQRTAIVQTMFRQARPKDGEN